MNTKIYLSIFQVTSVMEIMIKDRVVVEGVYHWGFGDAILNI